MKRYVIKDECTLIKTGEHYDDYYTGKDGYVWGTPEMPNGYSTKASAKRRITKDVNEHYFLRRKYSDNQYIESDKWLHTLTIVEVGR